jgi:hypothetical protein
MIPIMPLTCTTISHVAEDKEVLPTTQANTYR